MRLVIKKEGKTMNIDKIVTMILEMTTSVENNNQEMSREKIKERVEMILD